MSSLKFYYTNNLTDLAPVPHPETNLAKKISSRKISFSIIFGMSKAAFLPLLFKTHLLC
jgi:hypothetical protein